MTTESPLRSRLRAALLQARRARDTAATSTLRSVLSHLENAEAVPVVDVPAAGAWEESVVGVGSTDAPRRELTQADEVAILEAELASLREARSVYADIAPHRAEAARAAITLLEGLR